VNDTIVDPAGLTQPYKIQINPTAGQNGNITFNAANTYTGPTTVSFGSLIAANTTGSATGTGAVTVNAGATIGGTGKIGGALTNNGTIAPGLPAGAPATLAVGNNVIDGAGATWAIDLSGATADKLAVTGNIDLTAADTLAISGAGTGSSWVIATYTGALTGTFDTITSGYTVNYGSGTNSQITLNAVAAGLPGDFNSDGKVDAGDYVTWRKNNGTNNALANDNGLGTPIGQSHYDLWRANFGNPPGAGSGSGLNGAPVPEPAAMLLGTLALIGFLLSPQRRVASH
jgi:autotransporter-associated beta strand protein